ncbi:hypothetical protein HMPREF1550_00653 [Actinomyces sp. oral taxon 877 str. F0543]|nr:hypothetical protein HMPREF1550_00653 [Actinomyces sp. oral taxon 877 str. F0543]
MSGLVWSKGLSTAGQGAPSTTRCIKTSVWCPGPRAPGRSGSTQHHQVH